MDNMSPEAWELLKKEQEKALSYKEWICVKSIVDDLMKEDFCKGQKLETIIPFVTNFVDNKIRKHFSNHKKAKLIDNEMNIIFAYKIDIDRPEVYLVFTKAENHVQYHIADEKMVDFYAESDIQRPDWNNL